MKAVLIVDDQKKCAGCISLVCAIPGGGMICEVESRNRNEMMQVDEESKPDWCPINPLPEKRLYDGSPYLEPEYVEGWNACLDAITREVGK